MPNFPKDYRLTDKKAFDAVFHEPTKLKVGLVLAFVFKNTLGYSRLAIRVSKRNYPKAVVRNKIKRICRESFRHICSQLNGYDVVISVHRTVELDVIRLRKDLDKLWLKLSKDSGNE